MQLSLLVLPRLLRPNPGLHPLLSFAPCLALNGMDPTLGRAPPLRRTTSLPTRACSTDD
jgi:hypothetical protein